MKKKILSAAVAGLMITAAVPGMAFADAAAQKDVAVNPDANGDFTAYTLDLDMEVTGSAVNSIAISAYHPSVESEAASNQLFTKMAADGINTQLAAGKTGADLDVVTGATCSSKSIIDAVKAEEAELAAAEDTAAPAEGSEKTAAITASFVIGQQSYTQNGQTIAMDAAPFIDEHSRTMVPIRYIGNALGVTDDKITYNKDTKTASIGDAEITTGSDVITVNGKETKMDTAAVNKDGRIYVPARFITEALGGHVAWDGTTRTVTVTI